MAEYQSSQSKRLTFIILITLLLLLFIIVGTSLGSSRLSINDAAQALVGLGNPTNISIIWRIRLPRVLAAVMAGIALAVSGAVMQCILKNPLGSSSTLGISQAAAFGAAFAVVVLKAGTIQSSGSDAVLLDYPHLVSAMAFFFSLIAALSVLAISKYRGATPETMVLAGIAIGSLFSAGTTGLEYFADDIQLVAVIFWTFGDLGRAMWRDFFVLTGVTVPACLYFIKNAWNYNALNIGDETAKSLGVNTNRLRIAGMVVATLATSVAVSLFGIIAFVGLIVPHIIRRVIGSDQRFLIPASALGGGLFLLIADTLARTIIAPIVLPVGILTSFTGAPLFLYLLVKGIRRKSI